MDSNENACYLAVYGTLKQGGLYNHIIAACGRYVDTRRISGWQMYDNHGNYPYAVPGSINDIIVVELWQIPSELLTKVDALEDYPGYYRRTQLQFELEADKTVYAWFYFVDENQVQGLPRIHTGNWETDL